MRSVERVEGYEILNLGNSVPTGLLDLVTEIGRALGKSPQIDFQPNQPGDVTITYASLEKSSRILGYEPNTSMGDGIRKYVEWYRAKSGQ